MKIESRKDLKAAVVELKAKRRRQEELLSADFKETINSLKPGNIIRQGVQNVINTPGVPQKAVKALAGYGVGLLTKKLFIGKPSSMFSKFLGTALDLTVAKSAVNNADRIRAYAVATYRNLTGKNNKGNNHVPKMKIF